jgi:threonine/homoserine/homoserine lactone efflux protein
MDTNSVKFIIMGAFLGLTAGISPGPLLTLVLTETLKHNRTEGIKISLAPLITDLPIILATFFIFSKLTHFNTILGIISLLGGIFVAYLGYETINAKCLEVEIKEHRPESLKKGVVANFLNPNPYLFWFTVGVPLLLTAYQIDLITAVLFLLLFYIMLVGSKIVIVLLADRSRTFLKNKTYIWTMRLLGTALFVFSIFLFFDGVRLIK